MWDAVLTWIGCTHLPIPFGGQTISLALRYRKLDPAYEARAVQTWLRLVGAGDIAWDVGANVGLFTLITARRVGPSGRVVAWEPSPRTFGVLSEHIVVNGFAAFCEARNAAVADANGSVPFQESPDEANTTNRVRQTGGGATVQVPSETLNSYLQAGSTPPAVVKVDVEGAEVLALRGANDVLRLGGARPVFMVAVHPQFLPEYDCAPHDLMEIARRHEYVWADLTGALTEPTTFAEFLMVPRERLDAVRTRILAR